MKKALVISLSLGILCLPMFSEETRTHFGLAAGKTQEGPWTVLAATRDPGTLRAQAAEAMRTEMDRLRKRRLISGLCLAGAWAATALVDLLYDDGYRKYTVIPVIGPFITIATIEHRNEGYWPGAKELLIASGIAQCALATYFVISLAKRPKSGGRALVMAWPSLNAVNLRIQF